MPTDLNITHLKARPDFLRVARGRRYAAPGLVLQAKKRPLDTGPGSQLRVGFTATKKTGNAVTRNRIKRRLRAAADEVLPAVAKSGFDYVLVGRAATFTRPWQSLLDDLGLALQMVHQPRPKRSKSKAQGDHRGLAPATRKDGLKKGRNNRSA